MQVDENKIKDVFVQMTSYLGLKTEVNINTDEERINLVVKTEDAGRLIGKKGSSLESLGVLINRIFKKDGDHLPIFISVDGYQKYRKQQTKKQPNNKRNKPRNNPQENKQETNQDIDLEDKQDSLQEEVKYSENRMQKRCKNAAKEVKRWGEQVKIQNLSEDDSKEVVSYFANDSEIQAIIENDGNKKIVVIKLR